MILRESLHSVQYPPPSQANKCWRTFHSAFEMRNSRKFHFHSLISIKNTQRIRTQEFAENNFHSLRMPLVLKIFARPAIGDQEEFLYKFKPNCWVLIHRNLSEPT